MAVILLTVKNHLHYGRTVLKKNYPYIENVNFTIYNVLRIKGSSCQVIKQIAGDLRHNSFVRKNTYFKKNIKQLILPIKYL